MIYDGELKQLLQHRHQQIDENRAVSKSLDELRTFLQENRELIEDLQKRVDLIAENFINKGV